MGMDVSASMAPPAFDFTGWVNSNSLGNDYEPLPPSPGVYAIFSRHYTYDPLHLEMKLHYIGCAKNIYNRVERGAHPVRAKVQYEFRDHCIYFKECEDYLIEEKRLIQLHKPAFNKRLK